MKYKSIHDVAVGDTYGRLTVIEILSKAQSRNPKYPDAVCQCECGTIKNYRLSNIVSGNSLSCGCMAKELQHQKVQDNMIGKRFGRLVAVREAANSENGNLRFVCQCDCGNETNVLANALRTGQTRSCGCLKREIAKRLYTEDLTGQTFNELTAIRQVEDFVGSTGIHRVQWLWKCSCGREVKAIASNVKRGMTKSCGHIGQSYAEYQISTLLNSLRIPYYYNYNGMQGLINPNTGSVQYLDFVFECPDGKKIVIEHQGAQHFFDGKYADIGFGKLEREITDQIKRDYCREHNIPLYETRYDEDYLSHVKNILRSHGFIIPEADNEENEAEVENG